MKTIVTILCLGLAGGCMSDATRAGDNPKTLTAALTNADVVWDGNYLGLQPTVQGTTAQQLLRLGKRGSPALRKALSDPDKFAAAHVLLTQIERTEFPVSATHWNHLKVDLRADGTVDLHPEQREEMEALWQKELEEKKQALSDAVLRRVARAYSLQTRKRDEEERKQEIRDTRALRGKTRDLPGSATGRAVDRRGTPLAGAEVAVGIEGADTVLGRGITDENGHFAVSLSTTSYRGLTLIVTKEGYARWAMGGIYGGITDYEVRMDRDLNPTYLSDLVVQADPERRLWMLLEAVGTRQMGFEIEHVYPFLGSLRPDLLRVIRSGLFKKDLVPVRARQLLEYWHDPADASFFSNHWPADTSGETIQEVCKKYADYHFTKEGVEARTSHIFSEPITGPDGKHALVVFEVRYLHWGYSEHLVLFHDGPVWKLVMVQHDKNWEIERDF